MKVTINQTHHADYGDCREFHFSDLDDTTHARVLEKLVSLEQKKLDENFCCFDYGAQELLDEDGYLEHVADDGVIYTVFENQIGRVDRNVVLIHVPVRDDFEDQETFWVEGAGLAKRLFA